MKRNSLLSLAASLLLVPAVIAADSKKADAKTEAKPAAQKLIKVATLSSTETNREFQANVQLVQAQRQAAVELSNAMEKEKDPAKKKDLKAQYDSLVTKLTENNEAMRKAYGFSLDRNYTLEIEKANIYMLVTDEEAARIEAAEKAAAKPAAKK
jgi:phage repressor protein C with HTH and peptisase S24 domain